MVKNGTDRLTPQQAEHELEERLEQMTINFDLSRGLVAAWSRYIDEGDKGFENTRHRAAAKLLRDYKTWARPHFCKDSWHAFEARILGKLALMLAEKSRLESRRHFARV